MKLLEDMTAAEAAAGAGLGAWNAWHFGASARSAGRTARRAAALTLALLNAALAGEAVFYLAFLAQPDSGPGLATVCVRSLSLAAVAAVTALVLRAGKSARRAP
ncbi:MAG TPA: hypothetical protein VNN10_13750 [Dehalococcoidia bacterium]|nr:hypothetical protein [Dehalococcoidia bacterium]